MDPRSLDLTPADFWLWGYLKSRVYLSGPSSLSELKDAIRRELSSIHPDMLHSAVAGFVTRLECLLPCGGGHVEHILVAKHRKRVFSVLQNYKFPEIMKGTPKPVNDEEESADTYEFIADLTMKGIPVSQGVAKGYARVAVTLEEAADLKVGCDLITIYDIFPRCEILITYSTDIGWSPYFPIISGVVTELGGLISHGAVVSREYGLPCVVGLQGATKKFRTGDYVLLDGKKGILQRLPEPEEQ
ncbi:putative phosphoenolpyruvate synthase [Trichonephila clavipes]|nr:putative phosphoenolpyruvate synthase [Trichonephila clavipes]